MDSFWFSNISGSEWEFITDEKLFKNKGVFGANLMKSLTLSPSEYFYFERSIRENTVFDYSSDEFSQLKKLMTLSWLGEKIASRSFNK